MLLMNKNNRHLFLVTLHKTQATVAIQFYMLPIKLQIVSIKTNFKSMINMSTSRTNE